MGDAKRNSEEAPATEDGHALEGAASLSFEGALEQLEQTVARLEEGELPLEEALELFESGVKLSRHCNQTLEAAERRIEILIADRGGAGLSTESFDADDEPEEDPEDSED
jgi:exodeoxyribonuclease VII small subunit